MNDTGEKDAREVPIIEVREVTKAYEHGRIHALNGANLRVQEGEFVSVTGPSGCGKSTLLHLIAALDRPDSGSIVVEGSDLAHQHDLAAYRATEVGLIFQLHNLLPTLTASENVEVPMFEVRRTVHERRARSEELLAMVGMADRAMERPPELSGGERQRVAVARALANDPRIVLADEPTGSLDSKAGAQVLSLLEKIRSARGMTIVLVTHDASVASRADREVTMLDGRMV